MEPLPYKKMINEVAYSKVVITDSGGLQVEAFVLRRPCVTLREETEWTKTTDTGWNKVVGTNEDRILNALISAKTGYGDKSLYGFGDSKYKIRIILENL
jgi:UDP-GlcNAc3NAcA epimerase